MTPEQITSIASLAWMIKDAGAIGSMAYLLYLLLSGRVVTRRHMEEVVAQVVAARDVQTTEAKTREDEWKRLATRGTDIIEPLTQAIRDQNSARRDIR